MRVHITHGMKEAVHLGLGSFDDARIGMACRGDSERAGEVEVAFAFSIPNVNTFGALPDDGPGAIRRDEGDVRRFVTLNESQRLAGSHVWIKHPFARVPK